MVPDESDDLRVRARAGSPWSVSSLYCATGFSIWRYMLSEIISSYRVELAGMNRQTGPFAPPRPWSLKRRATGPVRHRIAGQRMSRACINS